MVKYRAPNIEPPLPIVDHWLADLWAQAGAYVPWMAAALVALWWLARAVRKRRKKGTEQSPHGSSFGTGDPRVKGHQCRASGVIVGEDHGKAAFHKPCAENA